MTACVFFLFLLFLEKWCKNGREKNRFLFQSIFVKVPFETTYCILYIYESWVRKTKYMFTSWFQPKRRGSKLKQLWKLITILDIRGNRFCYLSSHLEFYSSFAKSFHYTFFYLFLSLSVSLRDHKIEMRPIMFKINPLL